MPALTAQHLRKSFGTQVVLDDATFALARGEKVGLIGANGAGKSTLARILAGLEQPDGGTLAVRRGLTVRYLAQEPVLDPRASARSVVEDALTAWRTATSRHAEVTAALSDSARAADFGTLVGEQAELDEDVVRLGGWDRGHEALQFLHRLGVRDIERPCGDRSGGERRRIALAQLLVASPDVAIVDEPTNHLDADTAAWLEGVLADDFAGAVVLVTHDRYFLDAVAQRIVELERGRLSDYAGGYSDYVEKKAELLAHEERVEQNRQNTLRREREWLARGPKARGTKQKARIQRAVALEARGAATAGRPGEVALVTATGARQGKTVLELRGLRVAAAPGTRVLTDPIDAIVTAGDRIGVVGPNGVGKTTLMRAILNAVFASNRGEAAPTSPSIVSGEIIVGKHTKVAYLDQARAELDDDKSIFDDVRGDGGTVIQLGIRGRESMDLRSYLELFLFDPYKQRQKIGSLSGGERARVALAKVLREGANLLLFDEPTNDLDLPTLGALEELLSGFDGSAIIVTHDRAFLDHVATGILAFEGEPDGSDVARVTRYAGGYEDYVAQRGERRSAPPRPVVSDVPVAPAPAPAPAGPAPRDAKDVGASPAKGKTKGSLTYAERLELDTIVVRIEGAETLVTEVERLLADPSLYAKRGDEVLALKGRLDAARKDAASLVARWEALEAKKSGA
jgi:ATP-binding cassette subfamily F protein uup